MHRDTSTVASINRLNKYNEKEAAHIGLNWGEEPETLPATLLISEAKRVV